MPKPLKRLNWKPIFAYGAVPAIGTLLLDWLDWLTTGGWRGRTPTTSTSS